MKKSIIAFALIFALDSALLFSGCSTEDNSGSEADDNKTVIVFKPSKGAVFDADAFAVAKNVLETRLAAFDIKNYVVETDADANTITVEYSAEDWQSIKENEVSEYLSTPAKLTFRPENKYKFTEQKPDGTTVYKTPTGETEEVLMDGSAIKTAESRLQQGTSAESSYVIDLKFTEEGAKTFEEITTKYIHHIVSIWLDDEMISAPTVNDPITDGNAILSGDFTKEDADKLANQIKSGALPGALEEVK